MMIDYGGVAQIIIALGTLVGAIGALILGILNRSKIEQVHLSTNSKMDALIKSVGEAEKAKGIIEGRAEVQGQGPSTDHMAAKDVTITADAVSVTTPKKP
jgi:hypothetical protein